MGEGLHIGIILDGNRRYAKSKNLPSWKGHRFGAGKISELLDWCQELNIGELTLYSFSVENFSRPKEEKEELFKLFRENIKKLDKDKRLDKNNLKIRFIGRLDMFPKDIQEAMSSLEKKTKNKKGYIINFAMAYGGRAEIVDAVKKITNLVQNGKISIDEINEETITKNLYLPDEPDLIIRPGGEKRVSNFLIWQGYYSEWYFTEKLWPEFEKKDLNFAIEEFRQRQRRFGR